MRDVMSPRGPDDAGLFFRKNVIFGHRRLAIRDLSSLGHQPYLSPCGKHVLVYNGEIYNDDELRDELATFGYRFESTCDTEVLMAAWLQWGDACVQRLRGMFSFGVYDFERERLFVARDRCGVKPLFVASIDGQFVFASSIRAIAAHPAFHAAPNVEAMSHYLATLRLTMHRQTLYEGILSVLPAESVMVDESATVFRRYWKLPIEHPNSGIRFHDAVDEFESELRKSVAIRLKSDVPVGMMVSGGVDSNTLATIVRDEIGSRFPAVCGGGSEDDDVATIPQSDFTYAKLAASSTGFDVDTVRVASNDYRDTWMYLISEYGTPVSTPSDAIIFRVAEQLRRCVGVAIGGEGADELCCGYALQHWSGADFDLLSQLGAMGQDREKHVREALLQQYGCDTFKTQGDLYLATNSLIPLRAQQSLFNESAWGRIKESTVHDHYNRMFLDCASATSHGRAAEVLFRANLESLLSRLDSATMLAGLEARVPFTDHKLVEQAFRLPHRYRIDVAPQENKPWLPSLALQRRGSLREKRVLRSVARRLMPLQLADRPKASFPTPLAGWLTRWRDWSHGVLTQSPFAAEHFRPDALQQFRNLSPQLTMWHWPMLNLALWGDRVF